MTDKQYFLKTKDSFYQLGKKEFLEILNELLQEELRQKKSLFQHDISVKNNTNTLLVNQ